MSRSAVSTSELLSAEQLGDTLVSKRRCVLQSPVYEHTLKINVESEIAFTPSFELKTEGRTEIETMTARRKGDC